MISTFSNNKKRIARRGIDETSSKILHLIFKAYPKKLSIKELSKELKIKEKTTLTLINRIKLSGIPILITQNEEKNKIVQASINEPISWIIKEKESAEVMLELIGDLKMDTNNRINDKKNIIYRIYNEYVDLLNEVFDKWNSLRLFEQLNQDKNEFQQ